MVRLPEEDPVDYLRPKHLIYIPLPTNTAADGLIRIAAADGVDQLVDGYEEVF